MKYEILDKDASGVIVGSNGRLYRVEYPSKNVRTIGMSTSKVVTYIEFEVGEEIEDMAGIPIDEYIQSCNEVEQSMTSPWQIIYSYKYELQQLLGFANRGRRLADV